MDPRAGLEKCRKSCPPTEIRSPDRPARSQSLYPLSFPDPRLWVVGGSSLYYCRDEFLQSFTKSSTFSSKTQNTASQAVAVSTFAGTFLTTLYVRRFRKSFEKTLLASSCLSACNNSAPTGRNFMKFGI